MERVRAFIAIELPEDLKGVLAATQQELGLLGARVRWGSRETLHLTLKFLGDVERVQLVEVARAVEEVAAGWSPWEAELVGLGWFPPRAKPRVIWAGVGVGGQLVIELAEAVERALEPLGFSGERRRFHPHVTLGRVRSAGDVSALTAALQAGADRRFGAFEVDGVITFESELRPEGPVHTVVATARAGAGRRPEPDAGGGT